jgi:hypothetical protein
VLVNPDTGQALAWFDESKTLHPTKLPAGYTLSIVSPALPPLPNHLIGCYEEFVNAETGDEIIITQQMGVVQPLPVAAGATTAILVRGRQGVADQTSITGYEDGQTITVRTADPMVTTQDLVAMVDSVP